MATAAAILAFPFVGLAGAFLADRFLGLAVAIGLLGGFALLAVLVAPYYRKSGGVTLPDYPRRPLRQPAGADPSPRSCSSRYRCRSSPPRWRSPAAWRPRLLHLSPEAAAIAVLVRRAPHLARSAGCGRPLSRAARRRSWCSSRSSSRRSCSRCRNTASRSRRSPSATRSRRPIRRGGATIGVLRRQRPPGRRVSTASTCSPSPSASPRASPRCPISSRASAPRPGVGQARLTAGWALVVVGIVVATTAPALAAFVRLAILRDMIGVELADLPQWLFDYGRAGMLLVCGAPPVSAAAIGTACGAGTVVNGLVPGRHRAQRRPRHARLRRHHRPALRAHGADRGRRHRRGARHRRRDADDDRILARQRPLRPALRPARIGRTQADLQPAGADRCRGARGMARPPYRPGDVFAYAIAAPSVAAAGFFPALVLGIFWKRTTFWGALARHGGGRRDDRLLCRDAPHRRRLPPIPVVGLTDTGISAAASGSSACRSASPSTIIVSLVTPAPGLGRREVADAIRRPSPDPILEDHAT